MRWKTPPPVEEGTKRIRKCFAFMPRDLSDGNTVWLETYFVEEKYKVGYEGPYWSFIADWAKDSDFKPDLD